VRQNLSCEYEKHIGRKKRFPINEMYYQKWELNEAELKQAVKECNIFSLEGT